VDRGIEGYKIGFDNWQRMLLGGPLHVVRSLGRGMDALFNNDLDTLTYATKRWFFLAKRGGPEEALESGTIIMWSWFGIAFYLTILAGAMLGALKMARARVTDRAEIPLFLLISLLVMVEVHALVLGQSRYHFACMPVLTLLAARGYKLDSFIHSASL